MQQFVVDAEREAVLFEPGVLVTGFVQSQDEPGAGAAAGSEIHTDGLAFLVRKIGFQLLAGILGQNDHSFSLTMPHPGLPVIPQGKRRCFGAAPDAGAAAVGAGGDGYRQSRDDTGRTAPSLRGY